MRMSAYDIWKKRRAGLKGGKRGKGGGAACITEEKGVSFLSKRISTKEKKRNFHPAGGDEQVLRFKKRSFVSVSG